MTEPKTRVIDLDPFAELATKIIERSETAVDKLIYDGKLLSLSKPQMVELHSKIMLHLINGNFVGNAIFDLTTVFENDADDGFDELPDPFHKGKN